MLRYFQLVKTEAGKKQLSGVKTHISGKCVPQKEGNDGNQSKVAKYLATENKCASRAQGFESTFAHTHHTNKQISTFATSRQFIVIFGLVQGEPISFLLFSRRVTKMYEALAGYRRWRTRRIANKVVTPVLPGVVCSCCLAHIGGLLEIV